MLLERGNFRCAFRSAALRVECRYSCFLFLFFISSYLKTVIKLKNFTNFAFILSYTFFFFSYHRIWMVVDALLRSNTTKGDCGKRFPTDKHTQTHKTIWRAISVPLLHFLKQGAYIRLCPYCCCCCQKAKKKKK